MKKLLFGISLLALAASANAQIVFDAVNGTRGLYQNETSVVTGYTPTSATDSVFLLSVAVDGSLGTPFANYGTSSMTLLASNTRTAIFGIVLSNTTATDVTVKTGVNNAETILTYGTLRGVDTSTFGSLTTANGAASVSNPTITLNTLTGLSSGDYVLNVFSQNSMFNYTAATPSAPLASLNFFSGTGGASYTGGISGGIVGTAGDYTPSLSFTAGVGASGFPVNTNSTYSSSVAFTAAAAVPEPSTFAALAGLGALGFAALRRRRA